MNKNKFNNIKASVKMYIIFKASNVYKIFIKNNKRILNISK